MNDAIRKALHAISEKVNEILKEIKHIEYVSNSEKKWCVKYLDRRTLTVEEIYFDKNYYFKVTTEGYLHFTHCNSREVPHTFTPGIWRSITDLEEVPTTKGES